MSVREHTEAGFHLNRLQASPVISWSDLNFHPFLDVSFTTLFRRLFLMHGFHNKKYSNLSNAMEYR